MEEVRLQKYLASCGIASRRKAEEMINLGRVKVNGTVIDQMGFKVSGKDKVEVDGKIIKKDTDKIYIMLNKPVGYVTSVKDQFGRPTVIDLVAQIKERIFPVGRLDYSTSGLIFLTNDGDFTYALTHPKHNVDKVYRAIITGVPSKEAIMDFQRGLEIEDYVTSEAGFKFISTDGVKSEVEITIHEGKNRQVRKMCEKIGHNVIKLKRISIGNIHLGDLEEGKWRSLDQKEVQILCKDC